MLPEFFLVTLLLLLDGKFFCYKETMPRFYCLQPLHTGATIVLPDPVARHLQVLRISPGEAITLFNGGGGEYAATVTSIDRKSATVAIGPFLEHEVELPYRVTLAQALPEAAKMDWIIEKSVELGVAAIQPLAACRCVVRLTAERAVKKAAHWQGIIIAASEQSGRNRLARLLEVADYDSWITQRPAHQAILLTPRARQSLGQWAHQAIPQDVTFLIGPEGGFSETEEQTATAHGVLPLSIGSRVLRTETAGLAAVAALNAAWGQM